MRCDREWMGVLSGMIIGYIMDNERGAMMWGVLGGVMGVCESRMLYFRDTENRCDEGWKASKYVGESEYINKSMIRVRYKKGSYKSPKGGFQFISRPKSSSEKMEMRYKVYVSKDFDYVKGGKLPGLYGGEALSGGNKKGVGKTGISLRVMFREKGWLELYGYIPSSNPTRYGTSLMRKEMRLKRGWNEIMVYSRMNDVGKLNGEVRLGVNGDIRRIKNISLRENGKLKFSGIFFSTFFGGNSIEYAVRKDQELIFGMFEIK